LNINKPVYYIHTLNQLHSVGSTPGGGPAGGAPPYGGPAGGGYPPAGGGYPLPGGGPEGD